MVKQLYFSNIAAELFCQKGKLHLQER